MTDDGTGDQYSVDGDEIRFMWDYGVTIPLWTDDGLVPDDPEWLRQALGLSDALIARLTRWGEAMEARDGDHAPGSPGWSESGATLTRQGRDLSDALQREVGSRFTVTYVAW
jgi:hypothetical protein